MTDLLDGSDLQPYDRFAAVLLNNALWADRFAAIPPNRRLLLLPRCLHDSLACEGISDGVSFQCARCGRCVMNDLLAEARRLGYLTLVAEGAAPVMALIESGKVQAVLGVSCLETLQQVFPYMLAAGVPGLAIPLLRAGCEETDLDLPWAWEALYLDADPAATPVRSIETLRREVIGWFSPDWLADQIAGPQQTARRGRDWLAVGGKRWRPTLAAGVYAALVDPSDTDLAGPIRPVALAVECFHKASLIHDDIEDDDASRYDCPTLHRAAGLPIALNVGDFLLGEGYRLLGEVDCPPETRCAMIAAVADAQRRLCLGQGAELEWVRSPQPLSADAVLAIFREKTAPAFDVALRLGALAAGCHHSDTLAALGEFAEAIGMAYQLQDDLRDIAGGGDLLAQRPNILLALARRDAPADIQPLLERFWAGQPLRDDDRRAILVDLAARRIDHQVHDRLQIFRQRAGHSIGRLNHDALARLLRSVAAMIVAQPVTLRCCRDH